MSDDLPEPVRSWPLVERLGWILRQPGGDDVALGRLVQLVRAEKEQTAGLALSLHACTIGRAAQ